MLLREFIIYPDPYRTLDASTADWILGNAGVIGHAYGAALGRYETNGTWKIMVQYWPDKGEPHRPRLMVDDHRDVGVAMVNLFEDVTKTKLASKDEGEARLAALEVLHGACLEVARSAGWDSRPFEMAYVAVKEQPRYVVPGPWKRNRQKTLEARIVFEEFWNGTMYALEVRQAERSVRFGPQKARHAYIGTTGAGARSELKDPVWRPGDVVAIVDGRGVDRLVVTVHGQP